MIRKKTFYKMLPILAILSTAVLMPTNQNSFAYQPTSTLTMTTLPSVMTVPVDTVIDQSKGQIITSFALAQIGLRHVRENYGQLINQENNTMHKKQLIKEAEHKMAEAISKSGLSFDQYLLISDEAKRDPNLSVKITAAVQNILEIVKK